MIIAELREPFHVTAGYIGQPGSRAFYLQAEDRNHRVTVLVEKGQVDALAHLLVDLLAEADDEPATDWDRGAMSLRDPVDPVWRVGEVGVGLDEVNVRFLLGLSELAEPDEEPEVIRVWLDRDQARRLAAHAIEIVAEGRPVCRFCERPDEPGHTCPATNGYGSLGR